MRQTRQNIVNRVKSVLREYPGAVSLAFVFGSFASGRQIPRSDIDLALYFTGISDRQKTEIEQKISLLFVEPVHILRLEDEEVSPALRLEAVAGLPVMAPDIDTLNDFILSLLHRAHEHRRVMERLKRVA